MFRRILTAALSAGFVAGIFMTAVQSGWVIPLIERAEQYEMCTTDLECPPGAALEDAEALERLAYTALFNILSSVAFGLLLVAGFALWGGPVDWGRGIVWGLAGFAAFTLAPALGLPPKPPGSAYSPLLERQTWWLACVFATAAGLACLVFAAHWRVKLLGLVAMALPHIIGAPLTEGADSAPPEFVAEFITASLVTAGLFWVALGGFSGFIYRRLA